MKDQTDILSLFSSLNLVEQERILTLLMQTHEQHSPILSSAKEAVLEIEPRKSCPHCQSTNIYKRGKQNAVQMFSCKVCKKWYSETTGTPLWDIKLKSKWTAYLRCLGEGMSIRKSAATVEISIQTSFDWRHKILASLNSLVPAILTGIVECDELELAINNKGDRDLIRKPRKRSTDFSRNESEEVSVVQVITAVSREGGKYLKAVESKRLTNEEIELALKSKLAEVTTLITDKHPSYRAFGKNNTEIKHKSFVAKEHTDKQDKTIHLQAVNQVHKQVRKFLANFNGVSTKYLQNYLNWFAYEGEITKSRTIIKQWVITGLLSPNAYDLFWLFKTNAVNIRT